MSYNNGIFSTFALTNSASNIYADYNQPAFNPPGGATYANAAALAITPTITPTGGTVTNATSLLINSPTGAANNYSLLIGGQAPVGFGATATSSYFLIGATVTNTAITSMVSSAGVYRPATNSNPNGIQEITAFNPPSGTSYGTAVGIQITPTRGGAGTVTNLWNLVVSQPTGGTSATVSNVCADFKGLTYHEQGITFGFPGQGGVPGNQTDVLKNFVDNDTWTPTIGGSTTPGTGTYTSQTGYYTRIGNMIFLEATLNWTNVAGDAGNIQVQSLPFTVRNQTNYFPMTVPYVENINGGAGFSYFGLMFVSNTKTANLVAVRTNNTSAVIAIDNAGIVIFNTMYLV